MASQKKIIEMIAMIKTAFSYYAKDSDVGLLTKLWVSLLKDYPDDVVEAAVYKAMQTCKVPPTPADVIENIKEMAKTTEQTDEELWAVYHSALQQTLRLLPQFHYTYVDHTGVSQGDQARMKVEEIWNGLPEKIKMYLSTKNEMISRARELEYTEISFERTRFFKTMPIMEKRKEYSGLTLSAPEFKLMIE